MSPKLFLYEVLTAYDIVQNPIEAITQHEEHQHVYARDPLARGFDHKHLSHFIEIVAENQSQQGFKVVEVGAGTGGLTRQVGVTPMPLVSIHWFLHLARLSSHA